MEIDHEYHVQKMKQLRKDIRFVIFVMVVEPDHAGIVTLVDLEGYAHTQVYDYTEEDFLEDDHPLTQKLAPYLRGMADTIVFNWPDEWVGFQPETDTIDVKLEPKRAEGSDLHVTIGNSDFALPYVIHKPTNILDVVKYVERVVSEGGNGKKARVICEHIEELNVLIQQCLGAAK